MTSVQVLYIKPSDLKGEEAHRWVSGSATIHKFANSNKSEFTSLPKFKDYWTRDPVLNAVVDDQFLKTDPNKLQITTEMVIDGFPCYENECNETITFNAWIKKDNEKEAQSV